MSMNIRVALVAHVIENWKRFKHLTYSTNGDNFCTKEGYRDAMLNPATYGTTCELGKSAHSSSKFTTRENYHFNVHEMDTTLLRSSIVENIDVSALLLFPEALTVSPTVQSHNKISYLNSKAMFDTKEKMAMKEKEKRLESDKRRKTETMQNETIQERAIRLKKGRKRKKAGQGERARDGKKYEVNE
ncbi:hypothetical protein CBL_11576 [Carabus blaptoides fortunei]